MILIITRREEKIAVTMDGKHSRSLNIFASQVLMGVQETVLGSRTHNLIHSTDRRSGRGGGLVLEK